MSTLAAAPASAGLASLLALARERADLGPAWLRERRATAAEALAARGFPGPREEAWKYTNTAPIAARGWAAAPVVPDERVRAAVEAHRLHLPGGLSLVFVNGRFAPSLSSGLDLAPVRPLSAARLDTPGLEGVLGLVLPVAQRPFAAASLALFEDGAFVHLSKDTCVPVPIDLLFVSVAGDVPFAVAPRTVISTQPETHATVLERHVSVGDGAPHLALPVTEVSLARHSSVEHVVWQEDADDAFHVAAVEVRQDRDSRYTGHFLTLGAGLFRGDATVRLEGEGAECVLNGAYLVLGKRHADHHTRIDHLAPHGSSRELFKGVLDDHGTGVFDGRVVVHPGSKGTDSRQTNHNLLLSDHAVVDTRPELEIFHDDVKCAHGATIGRLDEDALFYLRTRGVPEGAARDLLVRAFVRDVTERVRIEPLLARLDAWMTRRLPSLRPDAEGRSEDGGRA